MKTCLTSRKWLWSEGQALKITGSLRQLDVTFIALSKQKVRFVLASQQGRELPDLFLASWCFLLVFIISNSSAVMCTRLCCGVAPVRLAEE